MKILLILVVIALIIFLILLFIGERIAKKLVEVALFREDVWYKRLGHKRLNPDAFENPDEIMKEADFEAETGDKFWESGRQVAVQSFDELILAGRLFVNANHIKRWVICVHGYRSTGKRDMAFVGAKYFQEGFSVLIPDLRAHGESQGEYIGMGWLDRLDILNWVGWLVDKYPDAEIILHGGSMGASAVLMTSGEKLPENVKLLIADSGFSSVYSEFKYILTKLIKFRQFPIMTVANYRAKKFAGFSLIEASAVKQLGSNHLPLLVIHGTADKFVPVGFSQQILAATAGEHQYLEIAEAGHLLGMTMEPDVYWQTVFGFISQYLT